MFCVMLSFDECCNVLSMHFRIKKIGTENRVRPSPLGFDFGLWDFGLGLDNKTFKETDLYSIDDFNSEQLKLFQCLGFVMLICKPELAQTFIRNPI